MVGAGAVAAARAARTNPEPPEASLSVVRQRKQGDDPSRGLARPPVYRGLALARASFPLPSLPPLSSQVWPVRAWASEKEELKRGQVTVVEFRHF